MWWGISWGNASQHTSACSEPHCSKASSGVLAYQLQHIVRLTCLVFCFAIDVDRYFTVLGLKVMLSLQHDPVLQLFSQQHLFRNDTAADPALLRGGSSETEQSGACGVNEMSMADSSSVHSQSVFSQMQSGHLARIDHNLWQV